MNLKRRARLSSVIWILAVLPLSACNPGSLIGAGGDSGGSQYTPDYSLTPPAHSAALPCTDQDASHLCLALKYVVDQDPSGLPLVSKAQAAQNVLGINSVWSQCHIQFYLETYAAMDPKSYGLSSNAASADDLQEIRNNLSDSTELLVATTRQWTGGLAAQAANGWTALPPNGPFGSILEESVALYPGLISHELGHYLNLQHVSDRYNVMNPVVYSNSLNLIDSQCSEARATALSFWGAMLR